MALTDTRIRSLKPSKKPKKIADGGGLYLEVRPSGLKLWRYRYRIAHKENVFAIGVYGTVSPAEGQAEAFTRRSSGVFTLAEARHERLRCRALVKQGIHPSHNRMAHRASQLSDAANTFQAITTEWYEKKKPSWSSYRAYQVKRYLETEAFPQIGALPIRQVTAAHLLDIVRRVENRGAATVALLLRQLFSAIFRYAIATLRAEGDPASALRGAITRPPTTHSRPLERSEIKRLLQRLESYGGYRTTKIAMRLMLLTFVRTIELRAARWSEIDFELSEWRVPPERMKIKARASAHIVPLAKQAIELLKELQVLTGGHPFLFPNYRKSQRCMSSTTLNRALERMGFSGKEGIGFSSHGFRATASTLLNELGFRGDAIERQLAHNERNQVRAAYNQASYLPERRSMMQAWADVIDDLYPKATQPSLTPPP